MNVNRTGNTDGKGPIDGLHTMPTFDRDAPSF